MAGLPVAIGGIGGSGTRAVARVILALDYFIGDDLNDASDNLWFTLLFKRRSALLDSPARFRQLARLFFSRMNDELAVDAADCDLVKELTRRPRLQHTQEWLGERIGTFFDAPCSKRKDQAWGWKEPNTHILIDRFLEYDPTLRYLHVNRDPLYLARSNNQNQLKNWGSIALDADLPQNARSALSYWCFVHRRIANLGSLWPGRILMVEYESLCARPSEWCARIASFLGSEVPISAIEIIECFLRDRPERCRTDLDLTEFDPEDLAYLEAVGRLENAGSGRAIIPS